MKKKVVSILTAVTLCAAMLAGCGGGNDEAAATETDRRRCGRFRYLRCDFRIFP